MFDISIFPFNAQILIAIAITVILLMLSGIISASEVAFFSLDRKSLEEIEEDIDNDASHKANQLSENPQRLLATILIGNNLVNVTIVLLLAYITSSIFDFSRAPLLGFVFQTIIVTFLILLFGEILPKIYASRNAKIVVLKLSGFIHILSLVFRPIATVLIQSTNLVNRKMTSRSFHNISKDELSQALELTSDSSDEDKEILEGIIRFGDKRVVDIMTSRVDMVDIDITLNYKQLLEKIIAVGYSRIPVFIHSRDNIKGVLYAKDLLPHLEKPANFRWQSLIRPAFYVPETKMIDDLLNDFQKNKVHLAIVVDEYGGTSGLVTLEDILEEIVGDISDEYDDDTSLFTKIDNHTYIFEAKIMLNDFFKIEDIDPAVFTKITGEVETLAGLILEIKGEMPTKNEQFDYGHYVFEIVSVDNRRIKKVKLYIKDDPKNEKD
ncbi:MAG: hemolysin [Porphyromonadaceae bacterium CG2_30_38_12]|nr:MAG: hemolysin [Porphyromonadaceae bacterium CG2_30_38_12]